MRILYITGYGRSGSTLLDRILGDDPRCVSCGEVEKIWAYGLRDDNLCSCGANFSSCEFWSNVFKAALAGEPEANVDAILRDKRTLRMRSIPMTWARRMLGLRDRPALERYVSLWEKIARGIVSSANALVMVDSSKSPQIPFFLSRYPQFDIRVLHLVRDSRAVAFSYGRRKESMESRVRNRLIKRSGIVRASIAWLSWNFQACLFGRHCPYLRLRYEDFMKDPEKHVRRIRDFGDLPTKRSEATAGSSPNMAQRHMLAGNPIRFQSGDIMLKPDREWEVAMPTWKKVVVTIITWPLLLMFNYALVPEHRE